MLVFGIMDLSMNPSADKNSIHHLKLGPVWVEAHRSVWRQSQLFALTQSLEGFLTIFVISRKGRYILTLPLNMMTSATFLE
jgi:hypothetical protein